MTSPTQLQYLNAMGIPVWVSRELVIDEKLEIDEAQADTPNLTNHNTAKSHGVNPSGGSNALENILQDLEEKQGNNRTSKSVANENNAANPEINETNANKQSTSEKIRQITESLNDEPTASKEVPVSLPNIFAKTAQHTVYAEGSLNADWMVIGQNPEFIEHEHGQPYHNEEGLLMENMLRAVGIRSPRHDAYLVNVLRNSQQNDSDAKTSKAELNRILQDSIKQVQPKVIVIVGQLAAQNILHSDEPLARLRGKPLTLPETDIPIVVTYYPSYLLSKPSDKRKAWEDLKLAISLID